MSSLTGGQNGFNWDEDSGWDDDELFGSNASAERSHAASATQHHPVHVNKPVTSSHNGFGSFSDENNDFLDISAPVSSKASQAVSHGATHLQAKPVHNHPTQLRPNNGHAAHANDDLFSSTSSGSFGLASQPTTVYPPASHQTSRVSSNFSDWDSSFDDTELQFEKSAPTTNFTSSATQQPHEQVSARQQNQTRTTPSASATQAPTNGIQAHATQNTRQFSNGAHAPPVTSTPVSRPQPVQMTPQSSSTQPVAPVVNPVTAKRPVLNNIEQTPVKRAPVGQHVSTPIASTPKNASNEQKTPISAIRMHKPSNSIKLPSVPSRSVPAKPVAAAPATAATPQSSSTNAKPATATKRVSEDGKPIPLTRASKAVSTAETSQTSIESAPIFLEPTPKQTLAPKIVQPVSTPISNDALAFDDGWGSDDFDTPSDQFKAQSTAVMTENKTNLPIAPTTVPVAAVAPVSAEKLHAATAQTLGGWDESWGDDDEDITFPAPAAAKPASTLESDLTSNVSRKEEVSAHVEPVVTKEEPRQQILDAAPVSEKPPAATLDLDWGEDEEEAPLPLASAETGKVEVSNAQPVHHTESPITLSSPSKDYTLPHEEKPTQKKEKIEPPKPKKAIVPTPIAPTPASVPSASEPPTTTAPKKTVAAFVPPSLKPAEPPATSDSLSHPSAAPPKAKPTTSVTTAFKPSVPSPTSENGLHSAPQTQLPAVASVPRPRVTPPAPKVAFMPSVSVVPTIPQEAPSGPLATVPKMQAADAVPMDAASVPSATNAPVGVAAARPARPKPAAPKMQAVIATPFGVAQTPSAATGASNRPHLMQKGPMKLEDMKRPHAVASFGFGGVLLLTFPRLPSSFSTSGPQAGPVSLLPTSKLLSTLPEYLAMKAFPGPALAKSTNEILKFVNARCKHIDQAPVHSHPVRSEAGRLLWHFIRLLLESKGAITGPKGCEKAMLALLASPSPFDPHPIDSTSPNAAAMATLPGDAWNNSAPTVFENSEPVPTPEKRKEVIVKIQELVMLGKREEALQHAMTEKIWDHALLLAAWISPSVHRDTVSAYVTSNLMIGSPLRMTYLQLCGKTQDLFKLPPSSSGAQALFTPGATPAAASSLYTPALGAPSIGSAAFGQTQPLRSGGAHAASTSAANPYQGIIDHWKQNIASALANKPVTPNMPPGAAAANAAANAHPSPYDQAMIQLGDALWTHCTSVEAAHLCYILVNYRLDCQMDPGSRFVLVGGDHKRHPRTVSSNIEALHKTELLEFAKRQGQNRFCFPGFQPYKLAFALTLADFGLLKTALEYLESIKLLVSEVKPQTIFTPAFLNTLKEAHLRVKSAVDGKPLAVQLDQGSTSQSTSWFGFGNLLKAAVDKVMGDEEEERAQMKASAGLNGAAKVPMAAPKSGSSTPLNASLNGPLTSSGPAGIPKMAPMGMPMTTAPTAAGVKGPSHLSTALPPSFPLPSVGHVPKMGAVPPATISKATAATGTLPHGQTPAFDSTPPLASGAPLPALTIPNLRTGPKFAPPSVAKRAAKATAVDKQEPAKAADSIVPTPVVAATPVQNEVKKLPTENMDDDEAELFGGWDFTPAPAKPSPTPSEPSHTDKEASLDKPEQHGDAKMPIDGDRQEEDGSTLSASTAPVQASLPTLATTQTIPTNDVVLDQRDVAVTKEESTSVPGEQKAPSPAPIATGLPPMGAPPKRANRKTPVGFKPAAATSPVLPPSSIEAVPTATLPSTSAPPIASKPATKAHPEEDSGSSSDESSSSTSSHSSGSDSGTSSDSSDEDTKGVNLMPQKKPLKAAKETPQIPVSHPPTVSPSAETLPPTKVPPPSTSSKKVGLPEQLPTKSTTIEGESGPQPITTPKRPSLLPPKKTPASKPAVTVPTLPKTMPKEGPSLAAPEGLPPLASLETKPFKPSTASTGLPPSTSTAQQKRNERMAKKSISASALPRPDALPPNASQGDDEAQSDDEKAQEKILEDVQAEIDRQAQRVSPVIEAPASAIPPISTMAPPMGAGKAKDKASTRKPKPKPTPTLTSTAVFNPVTSFNPVVPAAEPKPMVTPAKPNSKSEKTDETSADDDHSLKTPQQTKSSKSSSNDKGKEAPQSEPKKSRFGWLNPFKWLPRTPQQKEPKPKEVKLGGSLKDGPFYRHPELGWVERGMEEAKRKELAEAAAPPTKSDKKRKAQPTEDSTVSSSGDNLVTPQPSRGAFSRNGAPGLAAMEEPSTPSAPKSASGRNSRGRRYVGSSGDIVDTMRGSGSSSNLAIAPMTPNATGANFSVFTPQPAAQPAEELPTSADPVEPVATVRQAKKPKASKTKGDKDKKKKGSDSESSDEDIINSTPLTLSASIPMIEDDVHDEAPRKSRAERKAEAEAAAAAAAAASASPLSSSTSSLTSSGGRPKFSSPSGFRPAKSKASSAAFKSSNSTPAPSGTNTFSPTSDMAISPEPSTQSQEITNTNGDEPVETPEEHHEPEIKAPAPIVGLPALGLPPAGAARGKTGVRANRPKSAAARFQPMPTPTAPQ